MPSHSAAAKSAKSQQGKIWRGYGLLAALAMAAGLFAAQEFKARSQSYRNPYATSDSAYLALPDLIVTIGTPQQMKILRLSASLEFGAAFQTPVAEKIPHILDAATRKLRDLSLAEVMQPGASERLARLLEQETNAILGAGILRNILISQFIVS